MQPGNFGYRKKMSELWIQNQKSPIQKRTKIIEKYDVVRFMGQ